MSTILTFVPRSKVMIKINFLEFVQFCSSVMTLWNNVDGFNWENAIWKLPGITYRFTKFESRSLHSTTKLTPDDLFSSPFMGFAKAYIRYVLSRKPRTHKKRIIVALRLLEAALRQRSNHSDITMVSEDHFDDAEDLIRKAGFKDKSGIGSALMQLARFIKDNSLSCNNTGGWVHSFRGGNSDQTSANRKAASDSSKLPSDDAVLAIADIFSNGYYVEQDDEDVFVSSLTCMLMSAPMRISDCLYWPVSEFLQYQEDKNGVEQLYLPYISPKVQRIENKPIPATMARHAEAAFDRLKTITEEGRKVALHFQLNPDEFYKHPLLPDVPGDKILTVMQVANALGYTSRKHAESFLANITGKFALKGWTLNSLWQIILARHRELNPNFPYQVQLTGGLKPPKMSESLMCFMHSQLVPKHQTNLFLLAPLNRDHYAKRVDGSSNKGGIFFKHNYDDYKIKSHQFRHFLNTLMQIAGLPIEMTTKWSDRASDRQSVVYMHQSNESRFDRVTENRGMLTNYTMDPITEQDYADLIKGPVQVSQFGVCSHNFAFSPCRKFHDCTSCSELVACKGHPRSLAAFKGERDMVRENVEASARAIAEGLRSASRWYTFNVSHLERLNLIIQKLEDPMVPDGSAIQMIGNDFTHSQRVLDSKAETSRIAIVSEDQQLGTYGEDVAYCLRLLHEDKGDG